MRDFPHYLTALVFLLAAVAMFRRGMKLRTGKGDSTRPKSRFFWYILGLLFILFAGFKVIAILPATGEALREMAHADGFYAQRRALQRVTVGMAIVFSACGIGAMVTYGLPRRTLLPLISTLVIVAFAVIRWISLHSVDAIMGYVPWLTPAVEIAAAALAAWPAIQASGKPRKHRHGSRQMGHSAIHPHKQ